MGQKDSCNQQSSLRDHRTNTTWTEGIIIACRGCPLYEVDINGQICMLHLRPRYAAKSSKLETGPLDIILGVFGLPPL